MHISKPACLCCIGLFLFCLVEKEALIDQIDDGKVGSTYFGGSTQSAPPACFDTAWTSIMVIRTHCTAKIRQKKL